MTQCEECEELNLEFNKNPGYRQNSIGLKLALCLSGGAAIGLSIACWPFISPGFRKICLPYIPATTYQVENVFKVLNRRNKGTSVVDVGSGDGRIVIEAAKRGFSAHGVELNRILVYYSRLWAYRNNVDAQFHRRDLWKFNLSRFDNVIIFGTEDMMQMFGKKLESELIADSNQNVFVCRFPLPHHWKPIDVVGEGIDRVWVYSTRSCLQDS